MKKGNLLIIDGDEMKKGNLLIVDDEEMILNRLKFNLEEYADSIFTAINGVEALKIVEENEIHCVVCDINMPRMNGVDVIKSIRKGKNDVPFIFYTGHGNHDLMMEAVKYGAFDFLNKPNLEGLEDVVIRGLKEGYNRANGRVTESEAYVSEYRKLLAEMNSEDK